MSLYKYLTRVQLSPTPAFANTLFRTGYNNVGQLGAGNVANLSSPTQLGSVSWTQVATGLSHTSAIRSNGTLWAWGLGTTGQLGDSTLISKSSPVQVGTSSWSQVSVGDVHTLAIKNDGSLWGWGDNSQGQVGIAWQNIYSWTQLTTGWGGFLGIRSDGTLWAWGNNSNGQLGDSTIVAKSSPIQIGAGTNWSKVSIGYYNSIALKSDGSLWTWGQNNNGQMGDNTVADKSSPVQIGTSSWTQISNGWNHSAAIRSDGTLWTWGLNTSGQLGNTFFIPQYSWTQVSTSKLGNHTLAIRADGTLWSWGLNTSGQLGDSTTTSKSSPVQVGAGTNWSKISAFGHSSIAIKSDGTMWSWGSNGSGELGDGTQTNRNSPVQIGSDTNWSQIIGGPNWGGTNNFALAIKTDGSLWAWGNNGSGRLGDGTTVSKSSPVKIGTSSWSQISTSNWHVLAIRSDAKLFAWGGGNSGTGAGWDSGSPQGLLGDGVTIDRSSPVQIGTSSWIAVAATVGGGYDGTGAASAAVRADGTLWTWGVNTIRSAQYRLGDTSGRRSSPVQVGTDTDWSTVNLGFAFHYGVKTDGSIWGWGGATHAGGIGYFFSGNRITLQPSPQKIYDAGVFSKVTLGCDSSSWNVGDWLLAIRADGLLVGVGKNENGELGNGSAITWTAPVTDISITIPDNRYNMGNKSSPSQVGTGTNWTQIQCGDAQTIALKSDGSLWMWGNNNNGQLGDNTRINKSSPIQIGTSSWTQIFTGSNHTSAIKSDGTLWQWGNADTGQIGLTNIGTAYSWTQVSTGTYNGVLGIRSDGTLWGWGGNTNGTIGDGTVTQRVSPIQVGSLSNWSQVSAGRSITSAIKTNGSLWQWGFDNLNRGIVTPAFVYPQYSWIQVSASYFYTLAIRSDGKLFAWGNNSNSELGDGTSINRSSPVQIGTSSWTQIATGGPSAIAVNFAIRTDGALFAWGDNTYGQLGDGTNIPKVIPTQISANSWSQITTSGSHVMAIRSDNTLWSWGNNNGGQLGININGGSVNSPVQVGTSFTILDSSTGAIKINSVGGVLTSNVKPFSTGSSLNFTGNGYLITDNAANNASLVIGNNDFTIEFWYNTNTSGTTPFLIDFRPNGIDGIYPVIYQSTSNYITYYVGSVNRIIGTTQINVNTWYHIAVSRSGTSTKLFINGVQEGSTYTDTNNYSTGYNRPYIGSHTNLSSTFVNGYMSNIRLVKGTAVYTANFTPPTSPLTAITNTSLLINSYSASTPTTSWSKIATGVTHSAAIRSDGTLWTWGTDNSGSLGGDRWTARTVYSWSQLATGPNTTLAIRSDGKLFAWGENDQSTIGDGTTDSNNRKSSPVQIGTSSWSQVSSGQFHSLAIRSDGTLWSWGINGQGQCGQNNTIGYSSPVQIGTSSWTQIDAGQQFSVGIKVDGTLWAWGYNNVGQLGDGTLSAKSSPVQVSTGSIIINDTSTLNLGTNITGLILYSANTPFSGSGNSAFYNGSSYSISDINSSLQPATNNFTFEGWYYQTSMPATSYGIMGLGRYEDGFMLRGDGVWTNAGQRLSYSGLLDLNTWTHIACVRNSGTLTVYKNGTSFASVADAQNILPASSVVILGSNLHSLGETYYGFMSNVRYVNGTAVYTSNFTVPTSPLTAITNTKYLTSYSNITFPVSWTQVSAGESSVTAISSSGTLWAWGNNAFGQLGINSITNRNIPNAIGTSSWTQVSVGYSHVVAIRSDGTLWAWGGNIAGQLGTNDFITRSSPVQVGTESNWTQVASRIISSIALKSDGSLWAWGNNSNGELGGNYRYNTIITYPVKVDNSSWTKIGSGKTNQWNMAIRSDGLLFGWGYNGYGQLGIDTITSRTSGPVQIPDNTLLNRSSPVQVGTSSWSQIYAHATQATMAAIRSDGTLFMWGSNTHGQLGDGTTNPKSSPTQIGSQTDWNQVTINSAYSITVARKTDGSLWTWGNDDPGAFQGYLGIPGSITARSSPVQVFSHASWSNVSAGYDHFIYTQTDGSLWARGSNTYGQYGSDNRLGYWNSSNPYSFTLVSAAANFLVLDRSSPVQVGTSSWSSISTGLNHTLALKSDGKLFAWGQNADGQLGDGTFINKSSPVQIGTSSWSQISAGDLHSTAIRSDGALFTWGNNNSTKLGYATYDGGVYSWSQIGFNSAGAIAIRSDGLLFGWGLNNYGQLGQGNRTDRSSPVQIGTSSWTAVATTYDYMSMAIRSDGTLWAWGRNDYGQIGDGTTINRSIPVQVGSANNWSKIASSGFSSFAIKNDGSLWSWGYNLDGRLGNISEFTVDPAANYSWTQITASRFLTFAIRSDGTLWGTGINDQGQQLFSPRYYRGDNFQDSMVQFGTSSWTQVDTGWGHVMAIDIDGALWGWGYGQQGQIGTGSPTNFYKMTKVGNSSWTQVSAGGTQNGPGGNDLGSTMAIRADGTLWAWGHNAGGEVGDGTVLSKSSPVQIGTSSWTSISMGSNSAAAIRIDGTLWAWGQNFGGELGQNNTIQRLSPVQIGAGTNWSKVSVGAAYTLALKTDGSLWAWGYNNFGQLGFNDTISRSSPVQIGLSSWTNINAGYYTASAIKADGTFWSWGYNGTYQIDITATNKSSPVQIGSSTNWSQIANGENHSAALDSNGIVYTWGTNSYGQTGIPTIFSNIRPTKLGLFSGYVNRSSPVQVGTSSWSQVSTFYDSTVAIRSDNTLWAWGINNYGQLGDNTIINKSSPVQIGTSSWTQVSVGFNTTAAIRADGTLWAWGYNNAYGQVGDNTVINRSSPVQIGSPSSWSQVSMSTWMAAAVRLDGSLWVWGRDQEGYQQALANVNKNYSSPVQIGQGGNNTVWSKVYMGGQFSALAIRSDGLLFGWGLNNYGQLGIPIWPAYRMVSVGNNSYYTPMNSPVQIGTSSWSMVSASDNHTMAIRSDGLLFGWGLNTNGQLGDNSFIEKSSPVQIGTKTWSKVYAGTARTLATDTFGETYGWGNNSSNSLLNNAPSTIVPILRTRESWTSLVPASSGSFFTAAIKSDGTLWLVGSNDVGQLATGNLINPITGENGEAYPLLKLGDTLQINSRSSPVQIGTSSWTQIYTTQNQNLAIKSDGSLWSWGQNNFGQLGLLNAGTLDTNYRSSPMQIGTEYSWSKIVMGFLAAGAIRTNGTAQIWGYGGVGEQADRRTANRLPHELGNFYWPSYSSPVQIGSGSWIKVSAGQYENMAINSANNLFSWGRNTLFGLGDGTNIPRSSPVQVGTSSWTMAVIKQNANSSGAAGGITVDNKLYAWGGYNNWSQQLTKNSGSVYSWTQINQKISNGAAIRSDGSLWTWGINSIYGQLGISALTSPRISPVQVGTSSWSQIAVGSNHMVSIRADGTLWSWGSNLSGELGLNIPTTIHRSSPTQIGTSNNWSTIFNGSSHNLAIKTDGSLWTWGNNNNGQLGTGVTINQSSPVQIGSSSWTKISASENTSAAIRSDGALFMWGNNTFAQLGEMTYSGNPQSWSQIALGEQFATAIKSDGTLWYWGLNQSGYNGDPARIARNSPVLIDSRSWSKIGSGSQFSVGLRSDGTIWSYGQNQIGQLGLSHVLNPVYSPTQIGSSNNWTDIAVGYDHTLALRSDGALFTWGQNTNGQLGDLTAIAKSSPVQIGTSSWTFIASGYLNSSAIRSDGALFTWGYNAFGSIGDSTVTNKSSPVQIGTSSWTQVANVFSGTRAIKVDGTLWAWGSNASGELGLGNVILRSSPVQVGTNTNWVETSGGTNFAFYRNSSNNVFGTGLNTSGQLGDNTLINKSSPVQIGAGTNWTKLFKSCGHTINNGVAITSTGSLFVWGVNSDSRAGIGFTNGNNLSSPVQIGGNYYFDTRSSPVQVGTSSWSQVAVGQSLAAAIRADGTLWSWGRNTNGELGLNDRIDRSSPVQVGANTNWSQITIGDGQVYAIDNTGNLFAWGVNTDGRLGANDLISRSNPTQVGAFIELTSANISVPVNYSGTPLSSPITPLTDGTGSLLGGGSYLFTSPSSNYILNGDFTLEYWFFSTDSGPTFNDQFNVGTMAGGSGNGIGVRLNNSDSVYLNGQFGFVNDLLTLCPVQTWNHLAISRTGTTLKIFVNGTQRYTGTYTQILNSTGAAIYLFYSPDDARGFPGYLTNFRLINGTGLYTTNFTPATTALTAVANTVFLFTGPTYGSYRWSKINSGSTNTLAINTANTLATWSVSTNGSGLESNFTSQRQIRIVGNNSVFVTSDTPNEILTSDTWKSVAIDYEGFSKAAIKTNGTLWTWGLNDAGQLGVGNAISRSSPVQVGVYGWSSIQMGYRHAVALRDNNYLFTWGNNSNGQLGDRTVTNRNSPVLIGGAIANNQYQLISSGFLTNFFLK